MMVSNGHKPQLVHKPRLASVLLEPLNDAILFQHLAPEGGHFTLLLGLQTADYSLCFLHAFLELLFARGEFSLFSC